MSRPTLSAAQKEQQQAFLRSIQETPDDDAPRLIYADWLDDQGDAARADFIRTQCRLARMLKDAPERPALKAREAELLKRNRSAWLGPWDSPRNEAEFRRGFLDALRIGSLFGVGLGSLAPAVSPYLALLRTLTFRESKLAEALVPVLGLVSLPCLRRLECVNCVHGNAIVAGLVSWPAQMALAELALPSCEIGSQALRSLAAAPWMGRLRALDLSNNHFDDASLLAFLEKAPLRHLEAIQLTGAPPLYPYTPAPGGAARAAALLALISKNLPALTGFRMRRGGLGDHVLTALAGSDILARLTSLEVSEDAVTDSGVRSLAESPNARGLTTLRLRCNRLGDDAARALAHSPYLANLTCLDLGLTEVGAEGIWAIAESSFLRNLVTLRLDRHFQLPPTAVDPLLVPGRLPKLRDLVLTMTTSGSNVVERLRARGIEFTNFYHDG